MKTQVYPLHSALFPSEPNRTEEGARPPVSPAFPCFGQAVAAATELFQLPLALGVRQAQGLTGGLTVVEVRWCEPGVGAVTRVSGRTNAS